MPSLEYERAAQLECHSPLIAGLDEAGRGALAGPVTAGAVILPLDQPEKLLELADINDSKQLSAVKRKEYFSLIANQVLTWGVGSASAAEIDTHGILPATRLAMARALEKLSPPPVYLLIDGRLRLKTINLPQQSIIRGDTLSLSIAAASILAKVTRDREMIAHAQTFPAFGFERHKGYGTAVHRDAIKTHGPCEIHRRTFAPLKQQLLIAKANS
ncbi:MAG: ribonuclease HII [Ardenticatenaceae bacterium]|nr:ribonuclease HII [Ardenticatenaceae bacterium]